MARSPAARYMRKSVIEDLLKRDLTETTRKTLEKRLAELTSEAGKLRESIRL